MYVAKVYRTTFCIPFYHMIVWWRIVAGDNDALDKHWNKLSIELS
jgi:hypothetical protein